MEIIIGFALLLLGAACGGSFGLPSKYTPKDTPWEVLWGPFFFFVTLLIPLLGPLFIPEFFHTYSTIPFAKLLPVLIFGLLWGLGSMTLGMSFSFIGLSLAYSLNYGAQIATGALLPMAIHNPEDFGKPHGLMLLAGVAVCLVGVVLAGKAAMLKEGERKKPDEPAPSDREGGGTAVATAAATQAPKMLIGVTIGVLSGILCACYGVAASYTGPIGTAVEAKTALKIAPAFAGMALILWGGAVSACGYCLVQLTRNRTWGTLAAPGVGKVLGLALAMAILHDAAILLFGLGAERTGVPVGYAAFMSFAIMVGNFHGFRTGEWKGASTRSIRWIGAGIFVLILGVVVLASSFKMSSDAAAAAKARTAKATAASTN